MRPAVSATPRSSARCDQIATRSLTIAATSTGSVANVPCSALASIRSPSTSRWSRSVSSLAASMSPRAADGIGVDVGGGTFELQPQRCQRSAQLVRSVTGKRTLTLDQRRDPLRHRVERCSEPTNLGTTFVDDRAALEVAGGNLLGRPLQAPQRSNDGAGHQRRRQRCRAQRDQSDGEDPADLARHAVVDPRRRIA